MPIDVAFNIDELKEKMVSAGWNDVVVGGGYITWPSGMSRIPRFGYQIAQISSGHSAHGITATSHAEGQAPSSWEYIYSPSSRIYCHGGIIAYHYPNEVIALTSLYSEVYAGIYMFAKTYDPVTGELSGWYVMNTGGDYGFKYAFGLSRTYSTSVFACPTTYISKFAVIRPQVYTGVVKGILYDQAKFELGYRIGDEKFVRLKENWLVKI